MNLVGKIKYANTDEFLLCRTTISYKRIVWLLIDPSIKKEVWDEPLTQTAIRGGRAIYLEQVVGAMCIQDGKTYGSVLLLKSMLNQFRDIKTQYLLENEHTGSYTVNKYAIKDNLLEYENYKLVYARTNFKALTVELTRSDTLNFVDGSTLYKVLKDSEVAVDDSFIGFLDSNLAMLEAKGFKFDWLDHKQYLRIHNIEQCETIFKPAFKRAFENRDKSKLFIVAIDFEGNGLDTYDPRVCPDHTITTYCSISFEDNISYGFHIAMENYENIDNEYLGNMLTELFDASPLDDTVRYLKDNDGNILMSYNRSEIKTVSHNMQIDIMFGLLINACIWFDICTMQLGFNSEPFYSKGRNSLKDRVNQFFGVAYPELKDICGKNFVTFFHKLTDINTIQMYGCADTDFLRLYAYVLIDGLETCNEYFGFSHLENFTKYDCTYINMRTRYADFRGMRVNKEEATKIYNESNRLLGLYREFMSIYVGKNRLYNNYHEIVKLLGNDSEEVKKYMGSTKPLLDAAEPYVLDKWSGDDLKAVLFGILKYPVLVETKEDYKKKRGKGANTKKFIPKPQIDKDAVKHYLKYMSPLTKEEINTSLENQSSLLDLKLKAMYIESDFIDPVTGNVLIKKDDFNSHRYPFFYVIKKIGPLEKIVQSDLAHIVNSSSNYVFDKPSTTSAVTKRETSGMQTVSGSSKYLYLPYEDNYTFYDSDQASVEIRVVSGLSGDSSMIDPLNDPEADSHRDTAALFFNKEAYLIDHKTERNPVKAIAFGRIYDRGPYPIALQLSPDGEVSEEFLAYISGLVKQFDEVKAPIMRTLYEYADKAWQPKPVPEFMRKLHNMYDSSGNPLTMGSMTNIFGWAQHFELDETETWYKNTMRRKAMNFAVQGTASTLIRILWVRLMKTWYKKGYLQNDLIIPHVNVHDEITGSVHKSLDLKEIATDIRDAFMVKFKKFPVLFVGINFGHSWGEAKSDANELPVRLVDILKDEYLRGEKSDINIDQSDYLLERKAKYNDERVWHFLNIANENEAKFWDINKLSPRFTHVLTRGLLLSKPEKLFKVKDMNDPLESLFSYLVPFVVRNQPSNKTFTFKYKKYLFEFNGGFSNEYKSFSDLVNNNPLITNKKEEPSKIDIYDDEDDYYDFDSPNMVPESGGEITNFDDSFMRILLEPSTDQLELVKSSRVDMITDTVKLNNTIFKNMKLVGANMILKLKSKSEYALVKKKLQDKYISTSTDAKKVIVLLPIGKTIPLFSVHRSELEEFDKEVGNVIENNNV